MRIRLGETLHQASGEDHAPPGVTGADVLAGLRRARSRRRRRLVVALLLALALVVGLLVWLRPGAADRPAPGPTAAGSHAGLEATSSRSRPAG